MRLLLDTHIFLWFISGDKRLPEDMRDAIRDLDNEVYLSVVSLWEAIVKYQLGRLSLPQPPGIYLPIQRQRHRIASLSLDEASVSQLTNLPPIHRDPFDRMLICQALEHGLTVVTVDVAIRAYPVPILDRA
ncbi:MAG: type II toxin-antitoxin system VapC family toxin [Chloroflexi bacterium]|nr:MAG: type II toxin-antitoxin system VapC family toxin [Chloroflexota bacterium]RLC90172.1 MAG: type II toxin-antitoxin system VapC family toxin [Chloroflexota bacterium]